MKEVTAFVILLTVGILAGPATHSMGEAKTGEAEMSGKVQLSVEVPESTALTDQVIASITLFNDSASEVQLPPSELLNHVFIEVIDSEDEHLKRTKVANEKLKTREGRVFSGALISIAPGDSLKATVNVGELFEIKRGTFGIIANTAVFDVESKRSKKVWANIAEFEIR